MAVFLFAAGYLILVSNNPVSQRFNEIVQGDLSVIKKERYDPGDYFGGLQFRLLYWRFVPEILSENKNWVMGTSPANSQPLLDKKYIEKNVYIGDPARGDTGFLGYNTHSQLLESLLQSGIIGLIIFIFICFTYIKMILLARDRMMTFVTLLLLVYSLIESLFETQYGVLIFLFFPAFLYTRKEHKS
jgi:O-antigen ligase